MNCNLAGTPAVVHFMTPELVDVFLGDGWFNWSRFEIKRIKGKVFLNKVNGKAIKSEEFKDLCNALQG